MPVSTGWVGVNCGRKTVSTFGTNCSQFCFFVPISITFKLFDVEISKFSALRAMQPIVFTRCKNKSTKIAVKKGRYGISTFWAQLGGKIKSDNVCSLCKLWFRYLLHALFVSNHTSTLVKNVKSSQNTWKRAWVYKNMTQKHLVFWYCQWEVGGCLKPHKYS